MFKHVYYEVLEKRILDNFDLRLKVSIVWSRIVSLRN